MTNALAYYNTDLGTAINFFIVKVKFLINFSETQLTLLCGDKLERFTPGDASILV